MDCYAGSGHNDCIFSLRWYRLNMVVDNFCKFRKISRFRIPNIIIEPMKPRPTIRKNRAAQVSNLGRCRSTRGVVTQPKRKKSGYKQFQVAGKTLCVHQLVCCAFHGPPPTAAHTQVDHIDGDPSNNRADNLRWVTPQQNIRHSFATNKARASNAERLSKPILGRKEEEEWVRYASASAAARELPGLKPGNISNCCNGTQKTTGGYEFRFDTESATPELLEGEEWRDVLDWE